MEASHRRPGEGRLTVAEFLDRPVEPAWRDELVAGLVVREPRPGGRHGSVQAEVAYRLRRYLEDHPGGRVIVESGFVLQREPGTVRGPDVAFVAPEQLRGEELPTGWIEGGPDLAVEVVSPSDTVRGLREKAEEYLAAGTRLVWIVDAEGRTVEEHRPGAPPRLFAAGDVLEGRDVLPGFTVAVEELTRV